MYKILPLSKKIQGQIRDLQPSQKEKLEDAFLAIESNPFWAPGNKIGRFKGDLKHLGWHYRLTNSTRIHYKINDDEQTVLITFIGHHPSYY